MIKMLFRYLRARMGEGDSWAGISVLFLYLSEYVGTDLTELGAAVIEAMPFILTGNYAMGVPIIVGAILSILIPKSGAKLSKKKPRPHAPQPGAPMPPGAHPQFNQEGFRNG